MTSNEKIIKIATELLRNYFSEGLSLNDAKQFNEFRNYLEDVLGDEADRLFTAEVRRYVELAGERVGDLVLPPKSVRTSDRQKNGSVVKNDVYYTKLIVLTLLKFFKGDGFHLGSATDCRKLRVLAGSELNSLSDEKIDALVSKKIKPFENVCYPISQKTSDQIRGAIKDIFQSGCKIIYYSAFFAKNQDWLVPGGIFAARFLKYRIQRFLSNVTYNERYFEETPSELSECEKIKAEILNVLNPDSKSEISVAELVDQTFVPVKKLEETLEYCEEFEKIGDNWQIVPKDELESNDDVLLVNPFDYLPLSVATQEEEEERKRTQVEDVLAVHEDYEELLTPESTNETTQKSERTNESTPGEEKAEQDRPLKEVENLLTPNDLHLTFDEPKGKVAGSDFILCRYKGQVLAQDCSWNKLYVAVIKRLLNEYPQKMRSKLNQSLGTWDKIDFADQKHKGRFIREKPITDNFYVEGNNSAYDISKRIKASFDLCGIDINNIEIWYRKNKSSKKSQKNDGEKRQKRQKGQEVAKKINVGESSGSLKDRVEFSVSESNLAHTKPVTCVYQGENLCQECDWSDLYAAVISRLYKDYPEALNSKKNVVSGRRQRLFFTDEKHSKKLLTPRPVARDFYVEAHFSADDTVKKIKKAFELCGADLDDLEIYYRPVLRKSTSRNRDALNGVETSTDNKIRQIEVDLNTNSVEISVDASVAKDEKKTTSESSDVSKQEPENVSVNVSVPIDVFVFDYSVSYAEFVNTKPVICVFRNEIIAQKCSWREAYCVLVQRLFREYSDILRNAANKPVGAEQKVDFADRKFSNRFKKPFEIDENLYIESEPVAYELVQQIKRALNLCDVPFDDLIIWSRNSLNRDSNAAIQRTILELTERYGYDSSSMLEKCTLFANTPDISEELMPTVNKQDCFNETKRRFAYLLEKCFKKGYKLTHSVFWDRFQDDYLDEYSEELNVPQDQVEQILTQVGQTREGFVYPQINQEQQNLINTIINDITITFDNGISVIYVKAVFEKYRKKIAEKLQIYAPKALVPTLLENACEKFILNDKRFVLTGRTPNLREDVLLVAKRFTKPEKFEVWKEKLQFVPEDVLKRTILSIPEIVYSAKEVFFYAPNLPISPAEVGRLASAIKRELETNSYLTGKELLLLLEEYCPSFYWDPNHFTDLAVRDSIKYLLKDQFSFRGPVISLPDRKLDVGEIFTNFAKSHEQFSYEELRNTTSELVPRIYWEQVFTEAVRVSKDQFVRKDQVNFDVENFDSILEAACSREYMSIKEFNYYELLSPIGLDFKSNEFILESFLFSYSEKFKLIHVCFASDDVCGALVRKTSSIDTYNDLILDVLINSEHEYKTKTDALNYIVKKGYQKRKKYSGFEQILKEAKLRREQKNKKRD